MPVNVMIPEALRTLTGGTHEVKLEATSRMKMLANARALAITEAFDSPTAGQTRAVRVPA